MTGNSKKYFQLRRAVYALLLIFCSAGAANAASLLGGAVEVVEDTVAVVEEETSDTLSSRNEPDETASAQVDTTATLESSVASADVQVKADAAVDDGESSVNVNQLSGTRQDGEQGKVVSQDATAVLVGEAQAAITESLGELRVLADTGPLSHYTDSRYSSLHQGKVVAVPGLGGLLSAEVIHATTTAGVDQVDSTASLADLALNVAGITTVAVEFVRSEARAVLGGGSSGDSVIEGLSVGGKSVPVDAAINQVVPLLSGSILPIEIGQVIINEQESIPGGVRVNAIHVTVYGVGEVVIASSSAALPQ